MNMASTFAGAFATGHLISLADEWSSGKSPFEAGHAVSDDFPGITARINGDQPENGTAFADNASLFARSACFHAGIWLQGTQILKVTEAVSTD